jgi:RNase P subunit RPR2
MQIFIRRNGELQHAVTNCVHCRAELHPTEISTSICGDDVSELIIGCRACGHSNRIAYYDYETLHVTCSNTTLYPISRFPKGGENDTT